MDSIDSDDSSPNHFEIRVNNRAVPLPSPLTRKRDDDDDEEDVSDKEAKLIRRKRVKRPTIASPTPTLDSSPCASKISWTKNDELLILMGIVGYEDETNSSYRSDWDAIYGFIEGSIETNFSKDQLRRKIRKLRKKFSEKLAKSGNGEEPSFVNTHDHEIFKLSMAIWGKGNETACRSNVNTDVTNAEHEQIIEDMEEAEDMTNAKREQIIEDLEEEAEDVTNAEHEQITENGEQAKDMTNAEPEQFTEMVEQGKVTENVEQAEDVTNAEHVQITENLEQAEDVTNAEHEQITENVEQAKVGVEEFCLLQDALEAMVFPTLGEIHKKLLLQNLKNFEAEKGKELSEEWKGLLVEEMRLKIKKLTYYAKLTEATA